MKLSRLTALAVCAAFCAVSIFAAVAQAQSSAPKPRRTCEEQFKYLDSSNDGRVTRDEFMAAHHRRGPKFDERFRALDVNRDGYLTIDELCPKGKIPGGQGGRKGMPGPAQQPL